LRTDLARRRKQAGLSQHELAQRLGISQSLVCAIECGTRDPWPKFRAGCAEILGVPEDELFPEHEHGARRRFERASV
jgi:transcriptional regulator with XRE-family HTH domain